MNLRRVKTIGEIRALVECGGALEGRALDRASACDCVEWTLRKFGYGRLGRGERGVVCAHLTLVTGMSVAQLGGRIRQYLETGRVRDLRAGNSGRAFERVYTRADIVLLAEADSAYGQMSGKAMAHVFQRLPTEFRDARHKLLASISPSHIHNLRGSAAYRARRTVLDRTRPSPSRIGGQRSPDPKGRPGYIGVDTVRQGDRDGVKGLCVVNLVDTELQYQCVGSVPAISENHMVPVLEGLLSPFLNYRRPYVFPERPVDAKARTTRRYPHELVATPYEVLKRLPDAEQCLKPGVTFGMLDTEARAETDIEAAKRVARARTELFRRIFQDRVAWRTPTLRHRVVLRPAPRATPARRRAALRFAPAGTLARDRQRNAPARLKASFFKTSQFSSRPWRAP